MKRAIAIFLLAAAAIAWVGTKLTAVADRLADRTGLGEAVVGAVLLGASTSLPGITASVVAAVDGMPRLAFSNAVGGIAAQTAFLAVADLVHRDVNLEHAAASLPNLLQGVLLVLLLSLLVFATVAPPVAVLGVHPVTPGLFAIYYVGMRAVRFGEEHPMWRPRMTADTVPDEPEEEVADAGENRGLWTRFALFALVVTAAGWAVTKAVQVFVAEYDWLGESVAGACLTAVATSLPELVTSIAAVRRGALTLAVGGVIGGNCFDTLFAAVADVAYRDGSLFHAARSAADGASPELLLVAASITMTTLLLGGLLVRQKRGPIGIGFESAGVLVIYVGTVWVMTRMRGAAGRVVRATPGSRSDESLRRKLVAPRSAGGSRGLRPHGADSCACGIRASPGPPRDLSEFLS